MRERVEALRGRLRLRASPGTGAEVEVTLPLRASMA
jgi:signal transduction histidine kinase